MAKFDKEQLKKHQFWIGLGAYLVLWLIAVIAVKAGGDDTKQKKWAEAKKTIEAAKAKGPKTPAYLAPWDKHGLTFRKHKDVVWKKAWDDQAAIYTWPAGMARVPLYPTQTFGDSVSEDQNNRGKFRDLYNEQFNGLAQFVYPADFNGGFDKVFPKQTWNLEREPTREEIWLAEEDFWVRYEMLALLRTAMDTSALFQEEKVDAKEKLPEGVVKRRLFRNANWELNLLIKRGKNGRGLVLSEQSTIKNVSVSRQTQALANPRGNGGLPIRLFQENGAKHVIRVVGEPQPFDSQTQMRNEQGGDFEVQPVALDKPFYVEQLLDWEIAPIRRIDALAVGWHSHRTIAGGLKPREDLKALDASTEPAAAAAKPATTPAGTSTMPGGKGMPGAKGMPGGGQAGGADDKPADDVTPVNNINRLRYLHVTPQCRHLPIALRVVVDQAHIQDVLAAVVNSHLRVQITQVTFHHATNVQHNVAADEVPEAPAPSAGGRTGSRAGGALRPGGPALGMRPGGPALGMRPRGPQGNKAAGSARRGSGMMSPFVPGRSFGRDSSMRPPTMPGGPRAPGAAGGEKPKDKPAAQARLVELSVYGLATLYERPPPPAPSEATPGTPAATPGTPAPKAPGTPAPGTPAPGAPAPKAPAAPGAPAPKAPAAPGATAPKK
jgi:hypothetical protein